MRFRCVSSSICSAFGDKTHYKSGIEKVCVERIDFSASVDQKKKGQRGKVCVERIEDFWQRYTYFLVMLLLFFLPNLSAELARPYGSLRHTLARRRRAILLGTQKT